MSASVSDTARDEDDAREEGDDDGVTDDPNNLYGVRDGVLFIVDCTPPMFEKGPEDTECYFLQCLRLYQEILKEKLNWSRQDWMGLIFMGTEKWDEDPELKHILTLQKLNLISLGNLKETMKITSGNWRYYKEISSETSYPLHDAFWYATDMYYSIKSTMSSRKVVLFTCRDEPPMTDDNEKHRIRVQISNLQELGIHLYVCGLGNNWNEEKFYKDLEILSRNLSEEDYERVSLKDFVTQIKFAARNMAQIPLTFGDNVTVDVSIRNLTVKAAYLKPVHLSREKNAALRSRGYLTISEPDADADADEENDEESMQDVPIVESDLAYTQVFGGRQIPFSYNEVQNLRVLNDQGITILCAQPISYHPFYHITAPYFVASGKTYRKDNELFFSLLLNTCAQRDLMLTCTATLKKNGRTSLYNLIPSQENGGFLLYRIPFKEDVIEQNPEVATYQYDDEYHKPPTDDESIELFSKMIENLSFDYEPNMFTNPKLQIQMKGLEALVLDLEEVNTPEDQTIPSEKEMNDKLRPFMDEFKEIFHREMDEIKMDEPPQRKTARAASSVPSTWEPNEIRALVQSDMLHSYTVPQLKSMLKTAGLSCSGKKEDIIRKIKNYYS